MRDVGRGLQYRTTRHFLAPDREVKSTSGLFGCHKTDRTINPPVQTRTGIMHGQCVIESAPIVMPVLKSLRFLLGEALTPEPSQFGS